MIITAILLGLGLSMDAFAVSVTNGMCVGKLRMRQAVADGLVFGIFQALMPLIGLFLGFTFMRYIAAVDHWIGFILLAGIGVNMILGALKREEDHCEVNPFSPRGLLLQGVATSIDALAVGIGFSAQLSSYQQAYVTVAIIGLCTFLISAAGVYIGKLFGGMLKEKAEVLGGLILIGLGVKILVQHLFFS